ncbi:MAG TPA: MFS transporter [Bacillota bacterium]|nr:MFS transporter [Bacillota bacterium]
MGKSLVKLNKLERNWVLYDVGNSAFIMLVSTIIPIFFKNTAAAQGVSAADSTAYWGYALSASTLIVAVLGPILGALADTKGFKKPMFTLFMMLGVLGCAALAVPMQWLLFLAVFVIAKVGFNGSLIFYDSMLSDVTIDDRMDYVSSAGFAWGYIGSCIPFTISLGLILFADKIGLSAAVATGIGFALTSLWWLVATLPLLKTYEQQYFVEAKVNPVGKAFQRLGRVFGELKEYKHILVFLIAYFFYIDGVHTIIGMATSYGKDVGISDNNLLGALLLTQIVAFPCALLFGRLSKKFKTEDLIKVCIVGYFLITAFALQLDKAWEFWTLAVFVAVFQGAIQALSRSYYAKIVPKEKSSEYFGIYDIFGKGASFAGTTMMGVVTQLTGSSKYAVGAISIMFVIGYIVFRLNTIKPPN